MDARERLGGSPPAEGLAGAAVQSRGDGVEIASAVPAEVGSLGKVLAKDTVGVSVGATLSGSVRVVEVDLQAGVDTQLGMLAISVSWSHVNGLQSCPGSVVIVAAMTSRTASAGPSGIPLKLAQPTALISYLASPGPWATP